MDQNGGRYDLFYIGLDNDPLRCICSLHRVDAQRGAWAYFPTLSSRIAHEVIEYFYEQFGTEGASNGFMIDFKYLYVYQKTTETVP